jgi:uncharacterized membrane protein
VRERQGVPEMSNNFFRGLLFALPISLVLWAIIFTALFTAT